MVLGHGASGFAQELVTRAYLVTRFELLLRSRAAAVLLSAALFAAYHGYQSTAAVATAMAVGVAYGVAFLLVRRVWPLAIGHALYNIRLDLAA
ncbi:MAG: CPBP family intramembrane metalloprotease, partial [Fimbriimonas ginsengisoli]|nr:CPBP family intramembrane metalloprotease [Fimbriimonas ginsengisoli]